MIFEPQTPLEPFVPSEEHEETEVLPSSDESNWCLDSTREEDTQPSPLPQMTMEPSLLSQHHRSSEAIVAFRGRGTVMIGKGSVTFTGQRVVRGGETKSGSLIVPLSDVDGVAVENERVSVSVNRTIRW